MALPECAACTTRYAAGLVACPHCGSTERVEEKTGSVLPAITVQCPGNDCPAYGVRRRVMLRQPVPGVVEKPPLLCARCGREMETVGGWLTEENEMPKITKHEGPTNFSATWEETPGDGESPAEELTGDGPESAAAVPAAEPKAEGGEESSPGSSSQTSPEKPQTEPEQSKQTRRKPARTTGSHSGKAQTGSRTARPTAGGPETDTSGTGSST